MDTFFDLLPIIFFIAIFLYSGYLDLIKKLYKRHQRRAQEYTKQAIRHINTINKEVPNPAAQIWEDHITEDVQSSHPAYAEMSDEDRIHDEAIKETEILAEDEIAAHDGHHPLQPSKNILIKRHSRFTKMVTRQGNIKNAYILKELLDKPIALRK